LITPGRLWVWGILDAISANALERAGVEFMDGERPGVSLTA
jgi:hypothetical protein